jgi:hypothetical protein
VGSWNFLKHLAAQRNWSSLVTCEGKGGDWFLLCPLLDLPRSYFLPGTGGFEALGIGKSLCFLHSAQMFPVLFSPYPYHSFFTK